MLDAETDHVARELYCFGNFKILAVALLFFSQKRRLFV